MKTKLERIAEGWKKALGVSDIPPALKILANDRVAICLDCPEAVESWLSTFIGGELKRDVLGSGLGCNKCSCPLQAKAIVQDERCPLGKW